MSVLVLGLNYKTVPIGLLERVAVPAEHLSKALASLIDRDHIREGVILSTCNRVEVYAHVTRYHGGMNDLRNFFAEFNGLAPEDFAFLAYDYYDDRAAEHLFEVASGLDSMVLGERQIALQVKQAFVEAQQAGAAGRLLQGLFQRALRVGKRTRNDTGITAGPSSMVDVALDAAQQVLGDLAGKSVLVVGAGKMGGMAAGRMQALGGHVLVANRSREKGERLVARTGGQLLDWGQLSAGLASADLVLSSTGAAEPIISSEAVERAMAARPERPLVLVDIAVPRDVDPAAALVPGVTVLDVDAIRTMSDTGITGAEAAKARDIVREEAWRFAAWTRSMHVEPTIASLRSRAEHVRQTELSRLGSRLGDLTPRQLAAVEALTRGIVNTFLHDPSIRLKELAEGRGGDVHAAVLRELFELPE